MAGIEHRDEVAPERLSLSQAGSRCCFGSHPAGTVKPTPAVRPRWRSRRPIASPAGTAPPGEWKKTGSLRPPSFLRSARRRSSAPLSMVPSAAIHSVQPIPQALASPLATKNTIGGGSDADLVLGVGSLLVAGLLVAGGSPDEGARWALAGVPAATPRAAAIRRRPRVVMRGAGRPPEFVLRRR